MLQSNFFGASIHHEMARNDLPSYVSYLSGHFWMFAVQITECVFSLNPTDRLFMTVLKITVYFFSCLPLCLWSNYPQDLRACYVNSEKFTATDMSGLVMLSRQKSGRTGHTGTSNTWSWDTHTLTHPQQQTPTSHADGMKRGSFPAEERSWLLPLKVGHGDESHDI